MIRIRDWLDRLRSSLFALPALGVVVAFFAARWLVGVDAGDWAGESTVDSARAVLSTVASATMTFASIAFSVTLLVRQQGANQHSPRVLHRLAREPINRRVIAIVMATFTFCLVTLQRVRGPLDESGEQLVPQLSIAIAVVLGLVAILSVIAVISHTARTIDVSVILQDIVDAAEDSALPATPPGVTEGRLEAGADDRWQDGHDRLRTRANGWVTSVDLAAVLDALPPDTTLRLETAPGRYLVEGTILARVDPPLGAATRERCEERVNDAVGSGATRTTVNDPSFPIRQVSDVALRALSPGINDPTTALDAIFHLATLLVRHFSSDQPANRLADDEGRVVELPHWLTDDEVVTEALTELRTSAGTNPVVYRYLLEMLDMVIEAITDEVDPRRIQLLRQQAALVVANADGGDMIASDRAELRAAYDRRF